MEGYEVHMESVVRHMLDQKPVAIACFVSFRRMALQEPKEALGLPTLQYGLRFMFQSCRMSESVNLSCVWDSFACVFQKAVMGSTRSVMTFRQCN